MRRKSIGRAEIRRIRADKEPSEIICVREINENIRRIFTDKPLTRPLSALQRNCQFKERYKFAWDSRNEEKIKKELKERMKKYHQKPEVKERQKEHQRKYHQKPEVKERQKEHHRKYYQKPEVKARRRAYFKKYHQKPEVKARRRKIYNKKNETIR